VNAAKVRKDLSYFGSYGTPGTGYDVGYLLGQIRRELGVDKERPVVICGVGNLGHALAGSPGFRTAGFHVVGLFDVEQARLGEVVAGTPVQHISELADVCRREQVTIAVVATPASVAQDVSETLAAAGVTAILNFAPAVLSLPDGVHVRHVDLSAELHVLAFYQAHPETASSRQNGAPRRADHPTQPTFSPGTVDTGSALAT
jgi:redox-sensing transcriptional repressor